MWGNAPRTGNELPNLHQFRCRQEGWGFPSGSVKGGIYIWIGERSADNARSGEASDLASVARDNSVTFFRTASCESAMTEPARKIASPNPIPTPPEAPEPSSLHVSRLLWILLAASAAFLVAVQFYVRSREGAAPPASEAVADLPVLGAGSPAAPVFAESLVLEWDAVPGATQFHLRIHLADGTPVVDPVLVWNHSWTPSTQILPGLETGMYVWSVEALDSAGTVLAKSQPQNFRIQ